MAGHEHHHHDHVHLSDVDWDDQADQAEREGELLLAFVTEAATWATEVRAGAPVRRIVDLGSGPGVGTCELATRFPEAQVVAVDGSVGMLDRARQRAEERGLADRVTTLRAELPEGLAELEPADLVWASMSLHHVGDQVGLLRALRDRLAPGGVLAIAELDASLRVLPDDLGDGLADRLDHAAAGWFDAMREGLPHAVAGTDLPSMLEEAGFAVVGSRVSRLRIDAPLDDRARHAVVGHLQRHRDHLEGRVDEADLRLLDLLLDPEAADGALHRDDLFVRASRQLVLAQPR